MGLLDRWAKKKEKEQLEQAEGVKVEKTEKEEKGPVAKKEEKKEKVTKPAKAVAKETKETKAKVSLTADKILVRPLVTEKAAVAQSLNKYSFVVNRSATKDQVKRAIGEVYGVTPKDVNIINVSGKVVRFGRTVGRRSDYKKAVITLAKGKSINIHEGV